MKCKRPINLLIVFFVLSTFFMNQSVWATEEVKVPILLYHNLTDTYEQSQKMVHCEPALFAEHMRALKDAGYNTITFRDYYDFVKLGKPLPSKPIVISFDDGYTSNYTYAYPVLKELGMKATIFAITGRMGATDTIFPHFTWEQAKEMERSGVIDIESHTDFHENLEELEPAAAQQELRRSYYLLANELNKQPVAMAYPYGLRSSNTSELAASAGFVVQCLVGDKGVNRPQEGLTALKRLSVAGGMSGEEVLAMIEANMNQ